FQGEIFSKWCRENLNELAAEKELRTTRKGTFLVWRCRSLVDLYLSYLDLAGVVHHLPIKQLGRFFFLEGDKFRSLPELVVHHLTMREFSHNPVKIINSHKREKLEATHIAQADIDHVPGQPAFCVYRGDLLAEVGRIDDRWLLAKHLPSESIAFFDLTHTSILSDMDAAPEALPYFHGCSGEDQDDLVQRLAEGGRGSFLLRHSRQTPGAYALLVHTGEKIDKFLLEDVKGVSSTHSVSQKNNDHCPGSSINGASINRWRLSGRVFSSVSQIMHRYSIRPIQADVRLTHAILSQTGSEQMCPVEHSSISSPSTYSAAISSAEESTNMRDFPKGDRSGNETVVVASVSALYKNREDKEWRACNVALYEHSGTAILRIGDTSRGDRHSLILHHTELVCLHESMLAREATVFLSPLQSEPGVFLAFEPLHFFYTWFHLLRRYTVQRRVDVISSASSSMSYYAGASVESTEMSLLSMHIDKYKGTLLKPDTLYRVGVSLNGVGVANTPFQTPTTGSSVVFDAHFLLIVTSWSCDVQLSITAAGKSRPSAISPLFTVPLGSLHTPLMPSDMIATSSTGVERKASNGTSVMPFVVSSTRQRVVVLSRDAYAPLVESLLDEVLSVAEWASGKLPLAQRNLMCSVMVSLAWPHSLRALIERTLGKRIGETSGDNMLRQDSFASCLITAALRMSGKAILETNLGEERPRKEAQSEEWLVGVLSEVARTPAVSLVLACVAATVAANLPAADKEHVVRRAISATFVLRFANPLIIAALAAPVGSSLARGVQTAANAATMYNFVRDSSGEETATRLFDLFERVRESAVQTVMVEAYDTAPEQCALLCSLLASALSHCHKTHNRPPTTGRSIASSSSSSSSSTLTASSGSSMTSSISSRLGGAEASVEVESGCSSSLSSVPSTTTSFNDRQELTPGLARLLELHRS
ncbi:hypothetical protein PENTCL1PPCAC_24879, partial [Pristionchus entomophagus]